MPVYKEKPADRLQHRTSGAGNIAGYSDGIRPPLRPDLKEADKDYVRTIQTEDGEKGGM